jgi:hypothetical protein
VLAASAVVMGEKRVCRFQVRNGFRHQLVLDEDLLVKAMSYSLDTGRAYELS